MRLLDLFCGAGGCAVGYSRAGFAEIVGVDNRPQPRYPFAFVRADALEYLAAHGREFDAIHASPPCQAHVKGLAAVNRARGRKSRHADLIPQTRELLLSIERPWVVENVEGSPLQSPVRVCGTAFGLPIRRHRLFESSTFLFGKDCEHGRFTEPRFYTSFRPRTFRRGQLSTVAQVYGNPSNKAKAQWGPALGIDWMEWRELAQAIPPAYTEFIGRQLIDHLRHQQAAPEHAGTPPAAPPTET